MKPNNRILRKAALFISILILLLIVLNVLEVLVVASIWFVILFSLLGVLVPTLVVTYYRQGKEHHDRK